MTDRRGAGGSLERCLLGKELRCESVRVDVVRRNVLDVEVLRHEVHRAPHLFGIDVANALALGRIGQEVLDRNAEVLSCLIRIDGWIMLEEDRQRLLRVLNRPSPSLHGRFDEPLDPIRLVRDDLIANQPDRVKRFIEATMKAWAWSIENPQEALRSEEHTSELQSRGHLVCRLL